MPQPKRPNQPDRNDAIWTADDYAASKNLRRIWNAKYRALNLSQNKFARQWHISQPAVSNYLNSVLRLNPEIILKFARALDVDPHTIDPRVIRLMRFKKLEFDHAIHITTDIYHPRFFKGDYIGIDQLNTPKLNDLCVAYTNEATLIGFFTGTDLLHPITNQPQPIPPSAILHPIAYIIPNKRAANEQP